MGNQEVKEGQERRLGPEARMDDPRVRGGVCYWSTQAHEN